MKAKYRIKIKTYGSGRQEFLPQFRGRFRWLGINYEGEADCNYSECYVRSMDRAMEIIGLHRNHTCRLVKTEYKYID